MIEPLLVCALVTSAMFYLGSRAVITRSLWSRYPPWLARWFDCAACSGAWYGLIVGIVGKYTMWLGGAIPHPLVVMLCAIVWTPIVTGLMQTGFERLGSAIEGAAEGDETDGER